MEQKFKRVSVDLTDKEFLILAKLAHKKNITFNQLCNDLLEKEMNKKEKLIKLKDSAIKRKKKNV